MAIEGNLVRLEIEFCKKWNVWCDETCFFLQLQREDTVLQYIGRVRCQNSTHPTHFSIITTDRVYSFVTTGDAGNFSSVC